MNNRQTRVMAILLAALILVSSMVGCNTSKPHGAEAKLQQANLKLLNQWFELLQIYEAVYSSAFQSIEYMETYSMDNSWDSLLKARASASAAWREICKMEMPVLDLTENEIDLLIDEGIPLNAIQREFEMLESWHASERDAVLLFCYTLEDGVFMKSCVEGQIPSMATYYYDRFTFFYRYICYSTNDLLLLMDSADTWQLWAAQLPCMAACMDMWYVERSELDKASSLLLDKIEVIRAQLGSILGLSEYSAEIFREAIDTGNLDYLRQELNEIADIPGYFPIPSWLPVDLEYFYYVTDSDTQKKRLVQSGETLKNAPSACYIPCGEIPLEEVQSYEEQLAFWGIDTYGAWKEDEDTWQLLANSGNSSMLVEWTQEETILYLPEPIGCLIPELYLYALTEN